MYPSLNSIGHAFMFQICILIVIKAA